VVSALFSFTWAYIVYFRRDKSKQMKRVLYFIILIVLVSCTNTAHKPSISESLDSVVEIASSEVLDKDTFVKSEVIVTEGNSKDTMILRYKDFLKKQNSSVTSIPINDFLAMKSPSDDERYAISYRYKDSLPFHPDELFCLLLQNFKPLTTFDSLIFEPRCSYVIAYVQSFENGMVFRYDELESGGEINWVVPTTNDSLLRSFFSKFYTDGRWYDSTNFAPEEEGDPGCYITLKLEDSYIEVSIYCGC